MADLPKFKFYLKSDDTHYYVGDIRTSTVTTTTTPTPVTIPNGWLQSKLSWTRNMTYWGIFRALQSPYTFSLDAALILKYLYYTYGAQAVCIVQVQLRDDGGAAGLNGDWTYNDFFVGNFDFGNYKDEYQGVSGPLLQGGLTDILKANADTDYDFFIQDGVLPYFSTVFKGITLDAQYNYYNGFNWVNNSISSSNTYYLGFGSTGDPQPYSVGLAASQVADDVNSSAHWLITASSQFDPKITFNIPITYKITTASVQGHLQILAQEYNPNNNNIVNQYSLWVDSVRNSGTTFGVTASIASQQLSLPVAAGNYLRLVIQLHSNTTGTPVIAGQINIPPGSTLTMDCLFVLSGSAASSLRYIDVFKKLTALMTTPPGSFTPLYNGVSSFLNINTLLQRNVDNIPYKTAITTANGIGIIDASGPKITMKMSDLFKDASGRWMLGLGIDNSNNLILEELETFFDNTTEIADLGEVNPVDFTAEPAQDLLYNVFKCGQSDETYDNINGNDEVNTNRTFQLPLTISSIAKTLDLSSPYRRDMYGIENIRYNIVNKGIDDSPVSSDVFIIAIDDSGPITVNATPSGTITGFNYDNSYLTKYNMELTPKRDLFRNGALLHSILDNLDSESLQFVSGTKNNDVTTQFSWGHIREDDPVLVSDLPDKIFRPIYFTFKQRVPLNMNTLMTNTPYGYFSFSVNGVSLKGFAIDVGITPGNNDVYEFKLLCCPDMDITKLIRI